MNTNKSFFLLIAMAAIFYSPCVKGQTSKEYFFSVSYVSSSIVYVNAGRDDSLAVGDTLVIHRRGSIVCSVIVFAVSRRSTASRIANGNGPVLVGDTASIVKIIINRAALQTDTTSVSSQFVRTVAPARGGKRPENRVTNENIISGRIAVQYSGVVAADSRFDFSQPAALTRLEVDRLFGTSLKFSMYGRTYYDMSANYNQFGNYARLQERMYEFEISDEEPGGQYGYSAGRITSRYVGGLGTFDGGQIYYRAGEWTSGVLFGAQVGDRIMSVDGDDHRGALFLNYKYGEDFLHQYDGTIAYARELYEGKLDREFFYIQNLATIGTEWNAYQSAEVETQQVNNGVRSTSPRLSSTFLAVNYYPLTWFSANIGYDVSSNVYLFESMKTTPDTLIDRNYLSGYRLSTAFHLPYSIFISLNGTYRAKKDDPRDSRTMGGMMRMSAIAGSYYNADVRYMNIGGIYTNGDNITIDLDRTFFSTLSAAVRLDYYRYTLLAVNQTNTTWTATANINYRITYAVYSTLNLDRVWDPTLNSYRIYLETGIRF